MRGRKIRVVALDDAPPGFTGLQDVTVAGNLYDTLDAHRGTTAVATLVNATSPWAFDFSSLLIFDPTANATRTSCSAAARRASEDVGAHRWRSAGRRGPAA